MRDQTTSLDPTFDEDPMSLTSQITRIAAAAAVALTLLVGAGQAHAEVIDRIVAQVNSEIITLHDLKRASGPYLFAFGIDPREMGKRDDANKIYQQVLDDMINTRLLLQEARQLQLEITDEDVSRWVSGIYRQMNMSEQQFRDSLRARGIRWSDYRRYVHDNLLKVRVIQIKVSSRIKVSDDELVKVYRETFGDDPNAGQKTVSVSHIFIPVPKDADDARRKTVEDLVERTHARVTRGNEDFKEVAREVSAGPTAEDGGFLGTYRPGELGKAIDAAVFDTPENEITAPIDVGRGFHIFKVHTVDYERSPKVNERLEKLRQQLREEELNQELDTWVKDLRNKAYVRVLY